MERVKTVTIKDMENRKHFKIKLFAAMEGLDFIDHIAGLLRGGEKISIKPFLKDLLPLATLIEEQTGQPVQQMSLDTAGVMFENPLAILELGKEILDHQMVFMQGSAIFQKLPEQVQNLFRAPTLV